MGVFSGTFIPTGQGTSDKMSHLVDDLLTPRLMSFRQIHMADLLCELKPDCETWYTPFGNWLIGEKFVVRKNGMMLNPDTELQDVDPIYGTFKAGVVEVDGQRVPRDIVEATFVFDYFPQAVLEGFLTCAVSLINCTAEGTVTGYTVESAPVAWEGVIVDLAFAQAMEKLLLDYDLWKYRLVFAIGPNEVESGGGDITGQLTTLKQNAEERANKALDNPKFKSGNYLAPPTSMYFNSIRGFGASSGVHGVPFTTGRLKGWKPTKWA